MNEYIKKRIQFLAIYSDTIHSLLVSGSSIPEGSYGNESSLVVIVHMQWGGQNMGLPICSIGYCLLRAAALLKIKYNKKMAQGQ